MGNRGYFAGGYVMSSFLVLFGVLTAIFLAVAALARIPRLQHTPSRFRHPWFGSDLVWYLAAGLSTWVPRRRFRWRLGRRSSTSGSS
jgi:hypothetical protein